MQIRERYIYIFMQLLGNSVSWEKWSMFAAGKIINILEKVTSQFTEPADIC